MSMSEIFKAIRRLVLSLAQKNWTTQQINKAVADFLAGQGLEREMYYEMQKMAMREWVSYHTIDDTDRKIVAGMIIRSSHEFARIDGKIKKSVVDVVKLGYREKLSMKEFEGRLVSELNNNKNYAYTVARTTKLGFARASTVTQAIKAGVKRMLYDVPAPQRPFCAEHYKNEYTIAEIQAMSNGQGLPVLYYCGGWNCKHRWVSAE